MWNFTQEGKFRFSSSLPLLCHIWNISFFGGSRYLVLRVTHSHFCSHCLSDLSRSLNPTSQVPKRLRVHSQGTAGFSQLTCWGPEDQ